MDWQGYLDTTLENGKNYIDEALYYDSTQEFCDIFDQMFIADDVTGNGSGSYTFSRQKAKELVSDLFWDEQALNSIKEMGVLAWPTDPESADVCARCAALYDVSYDLEKYYEEKILEIGGNE